jgi:hypothetical protein
MSDDTDERPQPGDWVVYLPSARVDDFELMGLYLVLAVDYAQGVQATLKLKKFGADKEKPWGYDRFCTHKWFKKATEAEVADFVRQRMQGPEVITVAKDQEWKMRYRMKIAEKKTPSPTENLRVSP